MSDEPIDKTLFCFAMRDLADKVEQGLVVPTKFKPFMFGRILSFEIVLRPGEPKDLMEAAKAIAGSRRIKFG